MSRRLYLDSCCQGDTLVITSQVAAQVHEHRFVFGARDLLPGEVRLHSVGVVGRDADEFKHLKYLSVHGFLLGFLHEWEYDAADADKAAWELSEARRK